MKISLASDHAGFVLKEEIVSFLTNNGMIVHNRGASKLESVDYSDYAPLVVRDILLEKCDFGILVCASGIGMSMVANRYATIRAALCCDITRTILARQHNNANILCIGADFFSIEETEKIVYTFINTEFSGDERHIRRVNKFNTLGEKK